MKCVIECPLWIWVQVVSIVFLKIVYTQLTFLILSSAVTQKGATLELFIATVMLPVLTHTHTHTHTHTQQFESEIGQQSAEEDQVFLMAMQVICVCVNSYGSIVLMPPDLFIIPQEKTG